MDEKWGENEVQKWTSSEHDSNYNTIQYNKLNVKSRWKIPVSPTPHEHPGHQHHHIADQDAEGKSKLGQMSKNQTNQLCTMNEEGSWWVIRIKMGLD